MRACLPTSGVGCETTRLFHIVSNYEISTEADGQQGSFGVYSNISFAYTLPVMPICRGLMWVVGLSKMAADSITA